MYEAIQPFRIFCLNCFFLGVHIREEERLCGEVFLATVLVFFNNLSDCLANLFAISVYVLRIMPHKVLYAVFAGHKRRVKGNMSDHIKRVYILKVLNGLYERDVYLHRFKVCDKPLSFLWVKPYNTKLVRRMDCLRNLVLRVL